MSFKASAYKILIAAPSDVTKEGKAVYDAIATWNAAYAETYSVVLLPFSYENYSVPTINDLTRNVTNNQTIHTFDMAIAVFWTKLSTQTVGFNQYGIIEYLNLLVANKKPVLAYFSAKRTDPSKLDVAEYRLIKNFETSLKSLGMAGSYAGINSLKDQLLDQISYCVRLLVSGQSPREHPPFSPAGPNIPIKVGHVYLEDYEKNGQIKSFLVKGDTKPIKDHLKSLGGRWNPILVGWVFPKTKEAEIAKFVKKVSNSTL